VFWLFLHFFNESLTGSAGKVVKLSVMLSTTTESVSRTVLVVEDVDTCATLLEIALVRIPGVAVAWAASGQEALHLLGTSGTEVCALVTDLNMPCVSGFDLIARIRSDRRYAGLPIIVVSGDVDPGTPERVKRLGVDAFFAKPYSPASVRQTVESLLNERAQRSLAS
jgi:two-component system chemotaxis response regulator CheY